MLLDIIKLKNKDQMNFISHINKEAIQRLKSLFIETIFLKYLS